MATMPKKEDTENFPTEFKTENQRMPHDLNAAIMAEEAFSEADKDKDRINASEAECGEWDERSDLMITELPEVALVKVMEYLNLKERYYLTMTCRLFYDLFTHPQLWQIAHIDLFPSGDVPENEYSRWKLKNVMHSTMVEIVKRFSHLFQHLSLHLEGDVQRFDENSVKLLEKLRFKCRLESLTLKIGPVTSADNFVRRIMSYHSNPKDIPVLIGLIHNATRLKRLRIMSWPLFTEMEESNILHAIVSNEKMKSLESLSLFFIDVKKQTWTERLPKLPTVEQTLTVVSFLSNLTHLALRSPMISDETILALASSGRARLKHFQVLVTFAHLSRNHDGFKIPEIAPSSWQKLTKFTPHLEVEFLVLTRVPREQLEIMLRPEVPLASLSLLNYSHCDNLLLDYIATVYKSTLKTFKSLCDSSYCDQALKKLVTECRGLRTLAFHGELAHTTVMDLVDLTKHEKDKWDLFQFKEKNIQTSDLNDDDEDVVVKYDAADGKYYLGAVQAWHRDEIIHQKKIDRMVEHVRKSFGAITNLFST